MAFPGKPISSGDSPGTEEGAAPRLAPLTSSPWFSVHLDELFSRSPEPTSALSGRHKRAAHPGEGWRGGRGATDTEPGLWTSPRQLARRCSWWLIAGTVAGAPGSARLLSLSPAPAPVLKATHILVEASMERGFIPCLSLQDPWAPTVRGALTGREGTDVGTGLREMTANDSPTFTVKTEVLRAGA